MPRIRSVLWIGDPPGAGAFDADASPGLDLAWVRDVDEALGLALEGFDALVLDAPDPARGLAESRRLLARRALPPLLARVPEADPTLAQALLAAGVREVWAAREADAGGLEGRLARLEAEARRVPVGCAGDPHRRRGAAGTPGSAPRGATPSAREAPDPRTAGAGPPPLPARSSRAAAGSADLAVRLPRAAAGSADPAARLPRPAAVSPGVVGRSAAMREVFALLERAQRTSATVLLSGETGTGKEILAREIHRGSDRRERGFVAVNCAAFPDTLLESELFGHVRGSFTGADRDKQGLFELADRGTLFLDEVGETSAPFQAKLLRVLQEREVRAVGGTRAKKVDVRLVAATNRDLRAQVARGAFREDLYYRLAVFPIAVPPLRARTEDVLALAEHFLALHGAREATPGCRFTRDATRLLLSYRWPGNVRELENEVQRALALAEPGQWLGPELLSTRLHGVLEPIEAATIEGESLRESLSRLEAWLIRRTLERADGRRAETARRLGITREGLYKKMKRFGIE